MPTACVRPARRVFSPLDERLKLLPYHPFSPRVHACLVRLGSEVPFERVPALARLLLGVQVDADTVRRLTEAAGVARVACEAAALRQVRRRGGEGPSGPAMQQLSADGAMVPLRGGAWAEVRTLVVGSVERGEDGTPHATNLRYFSRLCSAAHFIDWLELPLAEAGTASAGIVLGIQDGADWIRELLDAHRPDAVRILDFAHAADHLAAAAQAVWGPGTHEMSEWLGTWLHALKHGDPATVIAAVRALPATTPAQTTVRDGVAAYLSRRQTQITYAAFRAAGYPIGSGAVESANKLLVEARLKGSGMHWERRNVTPMLALRTLIANDTWEEAWPLLWQHLQQQAREEARERRDARREKRQAAQEQSVPPPAAPLLPPEPPKRQDGKPTDHHPWRHGAQQRPLTPPPTSPAAKL